MSDRVQGSNPIITNQYQNVETSSTGNKQAERYKNTVDVLTSAFPFFGDQDRAVDSKRGKAEKPNIDKGTTKSFTQNVKDFFTSVGKLLASPFKAIARAFEKAPDTDTRTNTMSDTKGVVGGDKTQVEDKTPPKQLSQEEKQEAYIQSKSYKSGAIPSSTLIEFMARAISTDNIVLVDKVLTGVSKDLGDVNKNGESKFEQLAGNTFDQKIDKLLGDMAGALGFSLTPAIYEKFNVMLPELRERFIDDPIISAVLDKIENEYDFDAKMDESFNSQIDKLAKIDLEVTQEGREKQKHTILESAFRGNSFFTSGMKGLVMEHFDQESFGRGMLGKLDQVFQEKLGFDQLRASDLKLDVISTENGAVLMHAAKTILDEMLNPDTIIDQLGGEHIARLHDQAHAIINLEGVSSDLKNNMIQKLFVDQVFLRNLNPAITQMAMEDGIKTPAVNVTTQLVQVLINDANPNSVPTGDTALRFNELRTDARQKLQEVMEHFGFPFAEPQNTDWTPPNQGL